MTTKPTCEKCKSAESTCVAFDPDSEAQTARLCTECALRFVVDMQAGGRGITIVGPAK